MAVQAIVAMIPEPHATQVAELWDEIEQRFGVRSHMTEEFPHFSMHVARSYDQETAQTRLQAFAAEHPPLRARTAGIGVFPGSPTVMYVSLVRNPRLNKFHRDLWRTVSGLGESPAAYYRPERWIPHVTLVADGVDQYNMGGVLLWLSEQRLEWVFDVKELALLEADGEHRREAFRVPLIGAVED